MQIEADDRGGRVSRDRQALGRDREHREQIAMRMIALRRTRPSIARRSEIGARLQSAGRKFRRFRER